MIKKFVCLAAVLSVFGMSQAFAYPNLEVTPSSIDLGDIGIGLSASGNVMVQSLSDHTLNGVTVMPMGYQSDFEISAPGCEMLLPHGNCMIWVTFHPTAPGTQWLTLEISAQGETVTVDLNGTGHSIP